MVEGHRSGRPPDATGRHREQGTHKAGPASHGVQFYSEHLKKQVGVHFTYIVFPRRTGKECSLKCQKQSLQGPVLLESSSENTNVWVKDAAPW